MPEQSSGPSVAFTGVSKRYPGGAIAVESVSVEIAGGSFVALVGASGSGKSTLLKMINRLVEPSAGAIAIDGEEATGRSAAATARLRATRIGFVFQAFHLLPEFTARENALLAARTARLPLAEAGARTAMLFERVGLSSRADADVRTLSGGERQRVALCRALLTKPALLLADEPTGNLDPVTAGVVLDQLLGLAKDDGAAVVLVTHDPGIAARADRRLELRDGILHPA